jgi:addiction module HigA family antidote
MAGKIRGDTADGGAAAADELSPGEHLRIEIARLGFDQVALSEAAGVSRQSINNIINGRQAISRTMAATLGRLTGRGSDYWLRNSFPRRSAAAAARDETLPARCGVLVNHQILRAIKAGVIAIEPFAMRNIRAATINLTLNDTVIDGKRRINIRTGKGFVLRAGRAVAVTTKEKLQLASDHVGRIGTVNGLASRGILTSQPLQVEPGFAGRVHACLFNAGASDVRLRAEEAVLCLEISALGTAPAPLPPPA